MSAKIKLHSGQSITSGRIRNLSLGGVFVQMDEPLPFGTDIAIEFSLPGHETIKCNGFVIWSTKDSPQKGKGDKGIGIRLTELGVKEMRTLAEFVESQGTT